MSSIKLVAAVFFLIAFSSSVFASGSLSSDSGNMASSEYSKGKMIVHKQLMCSSCPLNSANLNESTAKDIVMKLKNGDSSLGSFQQSEVQSVVAYLQDRFKM